APSDTRPRRAPARQYLVPERRHGRAVALPLVAEREGRPIGHVAVSPVQVGDGSPGWYGLGPISVAPAAQGQGIGSRLMTAALQGLRDIGAEGCVLLGEPAFYARFGFEAAGRLELPGVPPEYFQALAFRESTAHGIVRYHPAFEARA